MTSRLSDRPAALGQRARQLAAAAAVVGAAWWVVPSATGLVSAVVDHARGHLELKRYGEPAVEPDACHRLLRERYFVTVDEAGCDVSDWRIRYIQAYNWYSASRLRAKLGKDASSDCSKDARSTAPRAEAPSSGQSSEPAAPSAVRGLAKAPEGTRRAYDRQRADAVRERAAAPRATARASAAPSTPAERNGALPASLTPQQEEARRREYLKAAVHEQYIPIARSCYEELLDRKPKAAGKVVLSFAIVGDGKDGVVDRVEVEDGTTISDPELIVCLRESMYTTVFEPPPEGAKETTVVYPLELAPD